MFKWSAVLSVAAISLAAVAAAGEIKIDWSSPDVVESRMTRYKYVKIGPEYDKPKPGQPDPGVNYMMELEVSNEPPALMDRVLKRQAKLSGKLAGAPAGAAGSVWLEDNYGRVLDRAAVAGPDYAFALDASRCLRTGLHLKAELKGPDGPPVSAVETLRMVPLPEDPWRDFILGVYNMGARPGTGELFRQLGLDHRAVQTTNSPNLAVGKDLQFHASNILYSLLGLYHRDFKKWGEIKAIQAREKGPVQAVRHRCLSDPKEQKFITDILTAAALRFRPFQPLHYSIGDEVGIGDMASPHDLCGSAFCRAAFAQFLQRRYATVERLNAEWGTQYKDFASAELWSNWMALGRAKDANFAPWADRLEFNDQVLWDAVALGAKAIRQVDPTARCNVSGVQQPSCWQFDHWRLAQTVNCATPYDIGEGPDVLASFYNDGRDGKVHMPGFGAETDGLWRTFLRGHAIAQQWDSFGPEAYSKLIDIDAGKLTPLGQKVQEFADWVHAGPGVLRNASARRRDPVAILYSQPSLRGNWILEMTARPDVQDAGAGWITRGSWSVRKREMSFRVRVSWVQWMHDVGIWPRFVDASQVDAGFLTANGYKVLVLPRAVAISDKTAAAIRDFAAGGGTVIADTWCGIMDEHCRLRDKPALDELFGVRRTDWRKLNLDRLAPGERPIKVGELALPFVGFEATLKAAGEARPAATYKDADVIVTRSTAVPAVSIAGVSPAPGGTGFKPVLPGRAIYLNFDLESYFLHRLDGEMVAPARQFLLDRLAEAGVRPAAWVGPTRGPQPFHSAGHEVSLYANGRGWLVGVMMNPTVMYSEVGGVETRYKDIKGNVFNEPSPARLHLPDGLFVYDLTDAKALGRTASVDFTSQPMTGRLYACWPFEIKDLQAQATLTADRHVKITGQLVLASQPIDGAPKTGATGASFAPVPPVPSGGDEKLAVALRLRRPDGSEQRAYRKALDVVKGRFEIDLPMALNESGKWTVELFEPCTGKRLSLPVDMPAAK